MSTVRCKLVTVVTEAALESELLTVLKELGASGYTITNARGRGSRGVRDAGWPNTSNIRVEVICSEELATKISEHLHVRFYSNYAMVIFERDVTVLREGKFS